MRPTEASRCYEFNRQTPDVLNQNLEQRDVLCFQNEHSDELSGAKPTRAYYKGFAGAKPASDQYRRRLSKKLWQKRKWVRSPSSLRLWVSIGIERMPKRYSTRRGYEVWLRHHILPQFGSMPIT